MHFDNMPLDPFADDPNDPASFIEDDDFAEAFEPLTAEEIAATREDLACVLAVRPFLELHGIRGVAMLCDDCQQLHMYDWDILISNMQSVIMEIPQAVHEPSVGQNIEQYVSWDYLLGYRDGMDLR